MEQKIVFAPEARRRLVEGMSVPLYAIAAAYGPSGRGTISHHPPAAPEILFHGLAIARECQPLETVKHQGSRILYETMYDFDRDFGDGSSSLALITHGLLARSLPLVQAGYGSGRLAEALFDVGQAIDRTLLTVCEPFIEERHAIAVCHTAAGGSYDVAEEIVSLMKRLGPHVHISVKEGHGLETRSIVYPGISLPAGLVSPALKSSEPAETQRYDDPHILLCDEKIEDLGSLVPILEGFARSQKSLVIFCRGITGSALATLSVNIREADLKAAAIAIPEVGDRVYEILEDIAAVTEGEVISEQLGRNLQSLRPTMLGRAERVEVSETKCVLFSKRSKSRRLEQRKQNLRAEIDRTRYLSYDKEKLQERLARLSGGVVEIHVGAHSLLEQKQEVLRYRKALNALQSARRSAVVPGGGAAYAHLATRLEHQKSITTAAVVQGMLAGALQQPMRHLIRSVMSQSDSLRLGMKGPSERPLQVFDVRRRAHRSSEEAGIFDSSEIVAEVIRRSIATAATVMKSDVSIGKQ